MSTTHPLGSTNGLASWFEHLLAHLDTALPPIDDEENEGYFDGTAEYIDRDDDEEDDDADTYLDIEDEEDDEDEDDLG
ncbi:MAG: hypothetical protein QGG74_02600 [Phycisphaerales bacterium]|jgi:hypothetical protein|nr:hypothetical protein [Phycisphaerales bacterium]MDP6986912.1 hypothetical protein [Phycisphaerales bacterium]